MSGHSTNPGFSPDRGQAPRAAKPLQAAGATEFVALLGTGVVFVVAAIKLMDAALDALVR